MDSISISYDLNNIINLNESEIPQISQNTRCKGTIGTTLKDYPIGSLQTRVREFKKIQTEVEELNKNAKSDKRALALKILLSVACGIITIGLIILAILTLPVNTPACAAIGAVAICLGIYAGIPGMGGSIAWAVHSHFKPYNATKELEKERGLLIETLKAYDKCLGEKTTLENEVNSLKDTKATQSLNECNKALEELTILEVFFQKLKSN